MSKLIKKNGLGGIAESVDTALDGLGTWGKLGVQVLDPTGITGWKDFGDSLKAFQKEGSLLKAGEMGLSALGVIPMFGLFKGVGKSLGKLGKGAKAAKQKKVLASQLDKVVKECVESKTISEANKKKILDISSQVDTLNNSTNSAEGIFSLIQQKISETLKTGGTIRYKYFE